jgi:hypothetical protein
MSFKTDYSYGLKKEDELLPIIKSFFQRDILKSTNKFERFDYSDEKYKYELKSRQNDYNKYPTTLIPASKICKGIIFLFNFTDGLYYIKYRKSKFNTFEKKMFVRNKRYDYNDKQQEYYYIPIDKLKKIN